MLYITVKCCVILWNKVVPHLYGLSRSRVHRQMSRVDLQIDGHLLLPMLLAISEKENKENRVNDSL